MRVLSSNDYKLLKTLVKLSSKDLQRMLGNYLNKKYKKVIISEKFIFAEGDIPVALTAHMDTVFKDPPKNIYYDPHQGVLWSPEGLGADDRAGIFAILKILQSGLRPSIIFTADEELGGLGADALIKEFPDAPTTINYIIELDRRGTSDCVFYECNNLEFTEYVESFGFIENYGSFSDISEICPQWGIAGVNLSIGYEDEHSYVETLHVKPMFSTISRVINMLKSESVMPKFFEYIPDLKWSQYYKKIQSPYAWFDDEEKCDGCGKFFSEAEIIPVYSGTKIKYFCPDCCVDKVEWCEECGEAFEKKNKKDKFCGGKKCVSKKSKTNLTV